MHARNLSSHPDSRRLHRRILARIGLLCLAIATWPAASPAARPAGVEWRFAGAYDAGADIERLALAWPVVALLSGTERIEAAAGILAGPDEQRLFVSVGPVWRLSSAGAPLRVEFSLSPTLLAGSTLDGVDLGGNLQFTSALAIGWIPGSRRPTGVALRLAHVSNGGLHRINPGLDTVGLAFTFGFDDG